MRLFSSNNPRHIVSLRDAVLRSLASDGGLFFPTKIPTLPPDFFRLSRIRSFREIAFQAAQALFQGAIFNSDLKEIIEVSLNFDAPLIRLEQTLHILELFHGETASFNDFSARFLAQLIKRYASESQKPILLFAAESEPRENAIVKALRGNEGAKICLLYPSPEANQIQEFKPKRANGSLTNDNLIAIEIQGSLHDCQMLIKEALRDADLHEYFHLTAANALNIAWIIPQIFCFMRAFSQLHHRVLSKPLVFAMPSGDFGALTAGVMAKKIGLPAAQFVIGLNADTSESRLIENDAKLSEREIINLERRSPTNLARLIALYGSVENMRTDIFAKKISNAEAQTGAQEIYRRYEYLAEAQTAAGYLGLEAFRKTISTDNVGVVLATSSRTMLEEKNGGKISPDKVIHLSANDKVFKNFLRECS